MQNPISSAKSRQFILSVGDEGAILLHMDGRRVLKRMFASSPNPEDTRHFDSLLKSDVLAPISLLIDVMDQNYMQQSLPPVSSLSVNKLIKRRMERDFAPEDIKGALPLGRHKEGRRDWNYLFISVPNTPPVSEWISYVAEKPHRLTGLYLLPIEAVSMVDELTRSGKKKNTLPFKTPSRKKTKADKADANIPPDEGQVARWHILVSHQKVGGFRQIVIKDSQIIFTRMAQPIGEPTPEVIAGNIEQELANTTEYLKRLSFNPSDGLDVTIVVADEIKQALNVTNANVRDINLFSPHDAATRLGLIKATEEGDHFGDVVLAAYFGTVRKHPLKLFTPYVAKLNQFNQAKKAVKVAASILVPLIILGTLSSGYNIYSVSQDITFAQDKLNASRQRFEHVKKATAELPHDMNRIADVVTLYEKLSEQDKSPLNMISTFAQAMDENTLVQSFTWHGPSPILAQRPINSRHAQEGIFTLEFLDSISTVDALVKRTDGFRQQLVGEFDGYVINVSDLPGTIKENELFEIDFGEEQKADPLLVEDDIRVTVSVAAAWPDDAQQGRR